MEIKWNSHLFLYENLVCVAISLQSSRVTQTKVFVSLWEKEEYFHHADIIHFLFPFLGPFQSTMDHK